MGPFALGLVCWIALLLWIWGGVGRSLRGPVRIDEEPDAPQAATQTIRSQGLIVFDE